MLNVDVAREGGDLDNVALEGGDQRVFCLWPVGDDLFRQVLQPRVHLDPTQVSGTHICVIFTGFNIKAPQTILFAFRMYGSPHALIGIFSSRSNEN